ncbi:hypothetical protein [Prevotella sp. S7-1-8]|nr:hypothetical protein [Prevotella sp. S7-1-8]
MNFIRAQAGRVNRWGGSTFPFPAQSEHGRAAGYVANGPSSVSK